MRHHTGGRLCRSRVIRETLDNPGLAGMSQSRPATGIPDPVLSLARKRSSMAKLQFAVCDRRYTQRTRQIGALGEMKANKQQLQFVGLTPEPTI